MDQFSAAHSGSGSTVQRSNYLVIGGTADAQPENQAAPRPSSNLRKGAAILIAVVVAAGATAAWASKRGKSLRRYQAEEGAITAEWQQGSPTKCGSMIFDQEYYDVTSGFGMNFDHIPDPEMCCAMCQGVAKCQAFTWVKDAGLDGNPSQCWLKGSTGTIQNKQGVVSGIPPARATLPQIPSGVGGSMFCYALMMPTGYEPTLLQFQADKKASIFACDKTGIYSNTPMTVGGIQVSVVNSTLKCGYGGDSQSALNSWIFIAVWQKVIQDGFYRSYGWTIKADPDTVFFPDRLRALVGPSGTGYISNCQYGLHGPLEIFSSSAIQTLAYDYQRSADGLAPKTCVERLHFGQWGEDMFIDQCLKLLGEVSRLDPRSICEAHCDCEDYYWCKKDAYTVSYHPFKTVEAYSNCLANAISMAR